MMAQKRKPLLLAAPAAAAAGAAGLASAAPDSVAQPEGSKSTFVSAPWPTLSLDSPLYVLSHRPSKMEIL